MERLSIDGYDPIFGARPLKRLIQKVVVDAVAEKIVAGQLPDGSTVVIDIDRDGNYSSEVVQTALAE